jgi:vanillate/4-hydroxybenzoate decarboxylase subunit C
MAFHDLRYFLEKLGQEGQLVRYTAEVMPGPDLRAICRAAADLGHAAPALLFDNIRGYKGKRLAVTVHDSWANQALMMDMPKTAGLKEQFRELARRWTRGPGTVAWMDIAPCQEMILERGQFNLLDLLPLFRINEHDGGFYLSNAAVVSKDPEDPGNFDKQNVGIYRLQVLDACTLAMQGLPFNDIAVHLRKAEELGQPLPVAVCLGLDPMLGFMAGTPLKYEESEYTFAAGLNGAPLELVKALGSDLDVPAGAEYVLEGEILPRLRVPEGTFGEFPGGHSAMSRQTLIRIKWVSHRENPIFENLYIGRPPTKPDIMVGLNTCLNLYTELHAAMPEVKAVNALYQHGLTVVIAVESRIGSYAKSAAFRAASTPHGISYVKNIILVNGDVDPFDPNQVMRAMSARIRGPRDVIFIPASPNMPPDPASEPPGLGSKVIIDCTTPFASEPKLPDAMRVEALPEAAAYQKILGCLYANLRKA